MVQVENSIFKLPFILLCLSSFLFSSSFNMLIPELPAYLSGLGGSEYKGLIIALFTLTAGISRPFSGKLTDMIGRVPVMAIGSLVCFVCGFLYPILVSISGFLFLRLVHGFSTGFKPTATAAYVADIVPQARWGEALGIHGLCFSTGLAIGPAIGSAITASYSVNALFYCSSLFALLSIIILMNMRETLPEKKKFHYSFLAVSKSEIIEKRVLPAAIVTFLSYLSYGALLTVISDFSKHLGMSNKGTFFMIFTVASLLVRFFAGKLSDSLGRVAVIKFALLLLTGSLITIGMADTGNMLIFGAVIYGFATGILSPGTSAWTADLSLPEFRGKAMATMYIALEAGIGLGALIAGQIFVGNVDTIPRVFYVVAFSIFSLDVFVIFFFQ